MDGTIQNYTLDMAADTKKDPLEIKQIGTTRTADGRVYLW